MLLFILQRIAYAVPILLGVSLISFGLLYMASGSPIDILLPADAPQSVIDQIKAQYGLDQPVYMQYAGWLARVLRGDLGISVFSGEPVSIELFDALGNTLLLAVPAAIIGFGLGILLGAVAAFNRDTWIDKIASAMAIFGVSFPQYWIAIIAVILFSVKLNWFPASGMAPSGGFPQGLEDLAHFVLPVLTLALIPMGILSRLVRSTFLETIGQEFTQGLRARGLRRSRIILHVARNASPPLLSLMGVQFGYLLGGSILTETIFNWPGAGLLMNLAIFRRDIPVLQAGVVVLGFMFVFINLAVDVLHGLIDPRLRT